MYKTFDAEDAMLSPEFVVTTNGKPVSGLTRVGTTHLAGFIDKAYWVAIWTIDGKYDPFKDAGYDLHLLK
jgi:hypothetical protein